MEVSHRDVPVVRDEKEWQGAGDVTHRKRVEVGVRIWRKSDTEREGSTFGARWGETNLRAMGAAWDEGQMNKTA